MNFVTNLPGVVCHESPPMNIFLQQRNYIHISSGEANRHVYDQYLPWIIWDVFCALHDHGGSDAGLHGLHVE